MSLDTCKPEPTELKPDRRTVEDLLQAAAHDSDAVSVFYDGTKLGDSEAAILVVKGMEHVEYLTGLCERQGLLTAGKPVQGDGDDTALWAVHVEGPDDLYPAMSRMEAAAACTLFNGPLDRARAAGHDLPGRAKVAPWQHSRSGHQAAARFLMRDLFGVGA